MLGSLLEKLFFKKNIPAARQERIQEAAAVETRLRERNLELTQILESLIEGVAALDAQGNLLEMNPAFCRLFSVDRSKSIKRPFLEVLRHPQLESLRQRVMKETKAVSEEVRLFAPEERIFEAQGIPLENEGNLSGAVLVLHEITRLRELEKIKQEFVANVSHELRTPLTSIKGFAETLLDGAIDDKKHRLGFLQSIVKQSDKLTELVNDLLTISALESGKKTPSKEPASLTAIASEIINDLQSLARERGVTLHAELEDPPGLSTDKKYLDQILTNLLTNAIQYNKQEGWVKIAAENGLTHFKVSVSDNGLGIPEKDLDRVFERFYRVEKDRSREKGGTGLGLSIVKHLVENQGGQVGVESKLGSGSTFWFTLPLK